jgi:dipeptidyl aminopeptidase/acylaminoacyl peptidase
VASATFAVVGHSAGAHLALLAAYKYNSQRRIKAVASLSGPTNFVDPAFLTVPSVQGILERYLGVTFAAQPARWTGASPVTAATATSPPTILVHGQLDALVPYTQAQQLNTRLLALHVPVDYRLFPAYNHDLNYVALNHFGDDVWDPTLAWFATYLK